LLPLALAPSRRGTQQHTIWAEPNISVGFRPTELGLVSHFLVFSDWVVPETQKDAAAALPSWVPLSPARGEPPPARPPAAAPQPTRRHRGSTHASPPATTTRARTQNNLADFFGFVKSGLHTPTRGENSEAEEVPTAREREGTGREGRGGEGREREKL
jgi:hypothetical protein